MKALDGAKVLVTGAGGFIGSHLCERLLLEGAAVTAMIHYRSDSCWGNLEYLGDEHKSLLSVVGGDVTDADFVTQTTAGMDIVFHLAALIGIPYSYTAPRSYFRTNVEGTLNVIEACRRLGIGRMIHTSTSEVYGTACYTPIDEKHPLQGQSPYSASKIGADKLVESYVRSYELPIITVRPFNTFGPRQSTRAVIPTIISQAFTSDAIRLGSLDTFRDLTYVQDTVRGFIAAALSGPEVNGEELNLGVGQTISIGELAKRILALMKVSKPLIQDPIRMRPAKSEVMKLISDNTKAKELLGWRPTVDLDDGLVQTIEFVRSHLPAFGRHVYTT